MNATARMPRRRLLVAAGTNRPAVVAMGLSALLVGGCGVSPPRGAFVEHCHDARGRVMSMMSSEAECKYYAGEWRLPAALPRGASEPTR